MMIVNGSVRRRDWEIGYLVHRRSDARVGDSIWYRGMLLGPASPAQYMLVHIDIHIYCWPRPLGQLRQTCSYPPALTGPI